MHVCVRWGWGHGGRQKWGWACLWEIETRGRVVSLGAGRPMWLCLPLFVFPTQSDMSGAISTPSHSHSQGPRSANFPLLMIHSSVKGTMFAYGTASCTWHHWCICVCLFLLFFFVFFSQQGCSKICWSFCPFGLRLDGASDRTDCLCLSQGWWSCLMLRLNFSAFRGRDRALHHCSRPSSCLCAACVICRLVGIIR